MPRTGAIILPWERLQESRSKQKCPASHRSPSRSERRPDTRRENGRTLQNKIHGTRISQMNVIASVRMMSLANVIWRREDPTLGSV